MSQIPVPQPTSTRASAPTASAPPPSPSPPPKPTAANANKSRLGLVQRGQLRSSLRMLFYGPEGVGKTSLAADAPSPLFIDIEGGADNIDAARYQFRDEVGGHVPRTYAEILAAIDDLAANPSHGFATLVLDSVDKLEALIHSHLCEGSGHASIEGFGYGKGYKMAVEEWRRLLARLDALRAQDVGIVLIGHSFGKTFKNPEGEDYDRYQLHIHLDSAGLIKEWCDVVGYMHFEGGSAKLKNDAGATKRARGWSSGRRLVELERQAAWDAKSRISLPAVIELGVDHPWQPFGLAATGARNADSRSLVEAAIMELDRIGADEFTTAAGRKTSRAEVIALVDGKPDLSILSRVVAGLKATESPSSAASHQES